MSGFPTFDFQTKSFDVWKPSMLDKKLLNNSCTVDKMVQIPIKSDQISSCISNYDLK